MKIFSFNHINSYEIKTSTIFRYEETIYHYKIAEFIRATA